MKYILFPVSFARTLIFIVLAFLLSLVGMNIVKLTSRNFREIGNKPSITVRRVWSRLVLWSAWTWVKVVNPELLGATEPVVLMTNHNSAFADIPAALALFPGELRIIAKRQLGRVWFIGRYLREGHFLLSRGTSFKERRDDMEVLMDAAQYVADHRVSLLVFPEGTRSRDGKLKSFKHGAFLAAIEAGLPIQPVALLGGYALMPKGAWLLQGFGIIRAVVCPKVQTQGRRWQEVAADVRAALLTAGCQE